MFFTQGNHSLYLEKMESQLGKFPLEVLSEFETDILIMKRFNLDVLIPFIQPLYSATGRPSYDPVILMRCWFIASRHAWNAKTLHKTLRARPILRCLCGIPDKHSIPALGSLYHFIDRLVPLNEKQVIRAPFGKKTKRPRKSEIGGDTKLKDKRGEARTSHLAQKIMKGKCPIEKTPEKFLNAIFSALALDTSLACGLLSPEMDISGDGTCLETGASSYGVKICDCKKKGIVRCSCQRRFSDPLANRGWDSSKKRWYYGYTLYFLSTSATAYHKDLPLYLRLVDAKRHDGLTSLLALDDFIKLHPNWKIRSFSADSAMDNYPTYQLLKFWAIAPIIDLNTRNKRRESQGDISFDDKGTPLCPGKLPMIFSGSWQRNLHIRQKFRCPAKAKKGRVCPLEAFCSKSAYGRTFYASSLEDERLYTPIPRESKEWKKLHKQRSGAERINKQVLQDHGLEDSHMRSKHRYFFMATLACIDIHLKAQVSILA